MRRLSVVLPLVLVFGTGFGLSRVAREAELHAAPRTQIQILQGREALQYWQQVLASNPAVRAAHLKAVQELTSRGFWQTEQASVRRQLVVPSDYKLTVLERLALAITPRVLYADQYSESDGNSEVILTSWDDGDNSTWEGEVYVHRSSDGAWADYDWQNACAQNSSSSYDLNYANRDGGDRDGFDKEGRLENKGWIQRLRDSIEPPVEAQNRAWLRAKAVLDCYGPTCLGAATACIASGPAWGHCTAAWCTGALVACAVGGLLR